jgi:hypothetical protein
VNTTLNNRNGSDISRLYPPPPILHPLQHNNNNNNNAAINPLYWQNAMRTAHDHGAELYPKNTNNNNSNSGNNNNKNIKTSDDKSPVSNSHDTTGIKRFVVIMAILGALLFAGMKLKNTSFLTLDTNSDTRRNNNNKHKYVDNISDITNTTTHSNNSNGNDNNNNSRALLCSPHSGIRESTHTNTSLRHPHDVSLAPVNSRGIGSSLGQGSNKSLRFHSGDSGRKSISSLHHNNHNTNNNVIASLF